MESRLSCGGSPVGSTGSTTTEPASVQPQTSQDAQRAPKQAASKTPLSAGKKTADIAGKVAGEGKEKASRERAGSRGSIGKPKSGKSKSKK